MARKENLSNNNLNLNPSLCIIVRANRDVSFVHRCTQPTAVLAKILAKVAVQSLVGARSTMVSQAFVTYVSQMSCFFVRSQFSTKGASSDID